MAKCYFAKHKLVWEVLDGGLKNKIEIQWSDILALKATYADEEPGTLELAVLFLYLLILLSLQLIVLISLMQFFFFLFSLLMQLSRQPLFFRETNPQPRKHTLWQATSDFTNEQASINRYLVEAFRVCTVCFFCLLDTPGFQKRSNNYYYIHFTCNILLHSLYL